MENMDKIGVSELTLNEKNEINGGNPILVAILLFGLGVYIGDKIGDALKGE